MALALSMALWPMSKWMDGGPAHMGYDGKGWKRMAFCAKIGAMLE
jgi:hypothetical protein